jgi:hypothetical protein
MPRPPSTPRSRWYGMPVRILLVTFIGTLLCFAVSLLLGIIGTVVVSRVRGLHPDMTLAYRQFAMPVAIVAGTIIFILAVAMEIRHHRQNKTLSAIERMS